MPANAHDCNGFFFSLVVFVIGSVVVGMLLPVSHTSTLLLASQA
jgi:hypothetical protein